MLTGSPCNPPKTNMPYSIQSDFPSSSILGIACHCSSDSGRKNSETIAWSCAQALANDPCPAETLKRIWKTFTVLPQSAATSSHRNNVLSWAATPLNQPASHFAGELAVVVSFVFGRKVDKFFRSRPKSNALAKRKAQPSEPDSACKLAGLGSGEHGSFWEQVHSTFHEGTLGSHLEPFAGAQMNPRVSLAHRN